MIAARSENHFGEISPVGNAQFLRRGIVFDDERAAVFHGVIQNILQRHKYYAQNSRVFFRQTDLHGEIAGLLNKTARAVERVNDPTPRFIEPRFIIRFLFR